MASFHLFKTMTTTTTPSLASKHHDMDKIIIKINERIAKRIKSDEYKRKRFAHHWKGLCFYPPKIRLPLNMQTNRFANYYVPITWNQMSNCRIKAFERFLNILVSGTWHHRQCQPASRLARHTPLCINRQRKCFLWRKRLAESKLNLFLATK